MNDKFSHMPRTIASVYQSWEDGAVEKCRNDSELMKVLKEKNICVVCMTHGPICNCVDRCRRCGKPFGTHGCKCPGPFLSAFDHKTGEKLPPEPKIVIGGVSWTELFKAIFSPRGGWR